LNTWSITFKNNTEMIYVLLLEQGKFYVGYTARPTGERFLEHFNSHGSKWTTKYRPLQVLEFREGGQHDENFVTLQIMEKYGWWNVRGGNWCNVEMTNCPPALLKHQKLVLPDELKRANINSSRGGNSVKSANIITNCNFCIRCGRRSHSINSCYASTDIDGFSLNESFSNDSSMEESSASEAEEEFGDNSCYRCGRLGHFSGNCFAQIDINGDRI
ncbi:hypothetical protein HDU92_003251, partial [Lobulomyces angularis]